MNLLFCINQSFRPLLCQCLRSIVKNGGEEAYDAYILHSDLTEEDFGAIETVSDRVHCRFVTVNAKDFEGFPESSRYPRQIFYRLAAPLLLPEDLDRILYLDVDTLVINPLRELYAMEFAGNYYIACTHIRETLTRLNDRRLNVPAGTPYVNTGVMVLNLAALRENLTMDMLRRTALEKIDTFWLPDQDLLTVMHGDKILLADTQKYNLSDRILNIYNANPEIPRHDLTWVRANTVIIHYCGKNRPWKPHYVGSLGVFYEETKG